MAIVSQCEAARRIAAAIGIDRARSIEIRLAVNDLVTIRSETYSTEPDLEALADELAAGKWVTISEADFDRVFERMRELESELSVERQRGLRLQAAYLREVFKSMGTKSKGGGS